MTCGSSISDGAVNADKLPISRSSKRCPTLTGTTKPSSDETRIAAIRLAFKDAESAGLVVVLEGPEAVAEAAHNLVDQLSSLVQDVREYAEAVAADGHPNGGDNVHEAGMRFVAERKAFLGLARDALDEVTKHIQILPGTQLRD
jgi:hypothetical protein